MGYDELLLLDGVVDSLCRRAETAVPRLVGGCKRTRFVFGGLKNREDCVRAGVEDRLCDDNDLVLGFWIDVEIDRSRVRFKGVLTAMKVNDRLTTGGMTNKKLWKRSQARLGEEKAVINSLGKLNRQRSNS